MALRDAFFEVESVKQLALNARLPTHHANLRRWHLPADGITVRRLSRALFQHYRSKAEKLGMSKCFPLYSQYRTCSGSSRLAGHYASEAIWTPARNQTRISSELIR